MLDREERLALAGKMRPKSPIGALMGALVGNDIGVYEAVLGRSDIAEDHLLPLEGEPSPEWRSKAVLALNKGYTTGDVLNATSPRSWSWSGPESAMLADRKRAYDAFVSDEDGRIAAIAREGAEWLAKRIEQCLERERNEAIWGR